MKQCVRCQTFKELSEFYSSARNKDGVNSYCKLCNNVSRIEQTKRNRRKAIELLGNKCIQCGYSKCDAALHFHHPDPSLKDDMFHRLRNRSWDYIKQTLLDQRCVLLCANCHVEHHYG